MEYDINHINAALVRAFSELLCGDSRDSAKSLEGTIAIFFRNAAGNPDLDSIEVPDGYVYPWRADLESLIKMCEAIRSAGKHSLFGGNWDLIRKMHELSEQYMEEFRDARDAGTYSRNKAYIRSLDDQTDWGKWMLAFRAVFLTPKDRKQ